MINFLRVKRSNHFLLADMLHFFKKFIFSSRKKSNGQDISEKVKKKDIFILVSHLRLDSFMELYDYMEDMVTGKRYSENNKENIINLLLVQINQIDKLHNPTKNSFAKKMVDIKNLIKLLSGETDRFEYFINKIFLREDNVSFLFF